jgi:hypothetical protein
MFQLGGPNANDAIIIRWQDNVFSRDTMFMDVIASWGFAVGGRTCGERFMRPWFETNLPCGVETQCLSHAHLPEESRGKPNGLANSLFEGSFMFSSGL